jgi:hypothetical protein
LLGVGVAVACGGNALVGAGGALAGCGACAAGSLCDEGVLFGFAPASPDDREARYSPPAIRHTPNAAMPHSLHACNIVASTEPALTTDRYSINRTWITPPLRAFVER